MNPNDEIMARTLESDLAAPEDTVRFMYEYLVHVPLWSRGHLPEDRAWLRDVLGIDDDLISDLYQWCHDMDLRDRELPDEPASDDDGWDDPDYVLERRARVLYERLRSQVGDRFDLQYRPWTPLPGEVSPQPE